MQQGLTVRPELVEGWTVKPLMVRQAHHERLNLKPSRLKWIAQILERLMVFPAIGFEVALVSREDAAMT